MAENKNIKDSITMKANTLTFLKSLSSDVNDQMLFKNFISNFTIVGIDQNNHVKIQTWLQKPSLEILIKMLDGNILKALEETFERECTYEFVHIPKPIVKLTKASSNKTISSKTIEEEVKLGVDLNKELTFDNYVESDFNKDAIKLANYLVKGGKEYNPIFIYAKSGLGKTHLLHAIGNKLQEQGKVVKYINPSIYARDISFYLQENDQAKLKKIKDEFDNADYLIFDDFQSYGVGNKKATIQTIYNILDYRLNTNKTTIFCSDKPINNLNAMFDERLISRLYMGLQLEIKIPQQSDLLRVLDYMLDINDMNPEAWEKEAKNFVTRNYSTSIRTLIGAITRLKFYKMEMARTNSKYTVAVVNSILKDMQQTKENITPDSIIEYVAKYYKIPKKEILGKSRQKDVVLARHIAIYVIRTQLEVPLEQIGHIFGNRDHSTIINAIRKIETESDMPDKTIKRTISMISDDIYKLK
ncbi:chromosomal replication initiator protein DnaA (plasmid) [Mesomycoplasma conjunctivae]|nr:chromosomal replication initiator protein DnaA [Mycoplasmopsis fermentans]ADV34013.1 Chromosomal replication initiator protein DnaA [Mycoplasmopsis fermentans M64]VEU60047.1 chromosomal replication initiator protein DnaA [Mycoplasmopsis fermentans]VEU66944.1 chromosomal replication initiator protein DnaA [Mesomycoplasma conjunctivae]